MKASEAAMKKPLVVALAGNPNCGKTTLFNQLTGARQHVGNYPGVTVEKKEGTCLRGNAEFHVVDLPGTYSLTAYSQEERVARISSSRKNPTWSST
jgi:ferrous iron transport protein B